MFTKFTNWLLLIFLLLLPWQTRWIYGEAKLNGLPWEYGTLSYYGTEILLWLIVLSFSVRLFGRKSFWLELSGKLKLSMRWPALLAGAAVAFFAVYFYTVSPVREVSAQFISRLVGSICLMVCLAASNLELYKMSLAFWSGAVIQGTFASWQFIAQNIYANKWFGLAAHHAADIGSAVVQTNSERWLRAYGSFGWPNSLAVYLALAIVIGLYIYEKTNKKYRPLIIGGQLLIFSGLLFTFSRSAFIALILGLVAYFIICILKKISLAAFARQGIVMLVLGSVFAVCFSNIIFNRVASVSYLEKLSLSERRVQYAQAAQLFLSHPLFGAGPGLYTYYQAEMFDKPNYGPYQPVHNIYSLSMVELGLFLYILFLIFIANLVYWTWQRNPRHISAITVLFVFGFFDHFTWSMFTGQALFWIILGLGLAKNADVDILKDKST